MAVKTRLALLLAVALSGAPFAACSAPADPGKETAEDLINVRPDDAAVEKAKAEARGSLGLFWSKFDGREAGVSRFSVKVGLPVKDGGVEHLWATPLSRDAEIVVVRLANDPVYIEDLEYGQEIEVAPALISDWSYEKNGKLYGHFTTRALMRTATPEQRAQVQDLLSPTPLEPQAK
ncbi:MAG: DUF2314 domain-containing protein [Pseudomonadota bacterium]